MDGSVKLLKTVKVKNGHQHIVYLNDSTGEGYTSISKGHVHPVRFAVEQKPDNFMPTGNGRWVVEEAEGHTHEMAPYTVAPKNDKQSDDTIVAECLKLYRYAKELERPARIQGHESLGFYKGDKKTVWGDAAGKLEAQHRAVLTINEIESKVDLLSGYQRQNRTDIKYMPTEEGDQTACEILNITTKNILENCNYRFEETDVFDDGTIVGRGLFNVYLDYAKDIRGDIVVEKFEWDDCYFGPHTKKDLSDLEYLIKFKWYSRAKLGQMYPEKIKELHDEFPDELDKEIHEPVGDAYAKTDNTIVATTDPDLIDIEKKSLKMLEVWRKEYKRSYVLVDADSDFYYNASDWTKDDIAQAETIPTLSVIPRVVSRMRITKIAADVLLEDEYPDLAYQDFHIIPFYAKKRGDFFWGKVHSVKDPQREINKRHSQMVDIMNRQAAYGWFYDDTTFPTPAEETNFKNNSSTPGFLQRLTTVKALPEKVEGAKVPTEVIQLLSLESQTLRGIMNINLEMEGNSSNAQSGIAILERKKQGLVGNEFLFDNFSIAKVKIGRMLAAMIQKHYTPERILRIMRNENNKNPVMLGGKPMDEMEDAAILDILKNTDLTKYDVVVSESGWSPTTRVANFMMWSELAAKGAPVPMPFLVKLSDLPDKEEVLQMFAQEAQAKQKELDDKNQVEIAKTEIAAQSKLMSDQNKPSKEA